jgi:hypothetical protein
MPTLTAPTNHAPTTNNWEVTVTYSGLTKAFTPTPHQTVHSLLELALNAFGIQNNRHTQSLYSADRGELADVLSLEAAGVKNHDVLLLRPSQVKGGVSLCAVNDATIALHARGRSWATGDAHRGAHA